ncbi:acyl-CoA reductase [Pedobacter frigiditerrae]|uniref:Acyl-CoA reductase n=1 Tax=Pedobacter frigiditerrae TaxID=2530452 RepID=A0A4R0MXQ9_9SPHI|nr:acyl-CoA reductase [Pedobacter frigiditerrae]TCC92079.1 acyl-CoA reductase [Pedobacter frigiditerrae]
MSSLTKGNLIIALQKLSEFMANPSNEFNDVMESASHHNAWFTFEEVKKAMISLSKMLNNDDLGKWFEEIQLNKKPKKVGLILAGNIPLVGFHDVLCVLATGNIALIKMSSADDKLLPALLKQLIAFEPALANRIEYVERLKDFDAIIATGSNNSSRYFDYYFSKVPNIIRKNRNSVAVLNGNETKEELENLGHDIFDYFGLGCRNVSKIYVPANYDLKNFFEPVEKYQPIINHFKYNNNYDYNKSIYLVNGVKHFDNGFLLVKEDENFVSPLAVLFYEEYTSIKNVEERLNTQDEQIQCVVSKSPLNINKEKIGFGASQNPKLWDYADNLNTIEFLNKL